jgi:hypothetical protein
LRLPPRALASVASLVLVLGSSVVARGDDTACVDSSERALALRKQGKLHDALKELAVCADPACPDEVKAECTRRIGEIDSAMPTVVFGAKDGRGNDVYAVKVTMDGSQLTTSLDGRPLSIDPGEHAFVFEPEGQPPLQKTLVLREGEKDRRETVTLGTAPPSSPAPTTPAAPAAEPPSAWTTQRKIALVVAGVGVAGLGVGALFGGLAISSQTSEKNDCPAPGCAGHARAVDDFNAANRDAIASDIAFIAGGTLVAAGTVLWFTSRTPQASTPAGRLRIAPSFTGKASGVLVGGEF